MDRLGPPDIEKQIMRLLALGASTIALAFLGAYFTRDWKWSEFVFTLFGSLPILVGVWFFCLSNLHRQMQVEKLQRTAFGEEFSCFEKLPFGTLAANESGVGITYTPMTEVKLDWSEIRAYTLSQFGKSLITKKFDPDCPDPKLRSWPKPVIILQTNLPDFPVLPLVFVTMESANRWVEIFEHRKPTERGFRLENPPSLVVRARYFGLIASLVLLTSSVCVFVLSGPPFHLLNNQQSTSLSGFSMATSMFASSISMWQPTAKLALIQTINPEIDWYNSETLSPLAPVHGALWISETHNSLERIGLDEIQSIEVKLKSQSIWAGRDLFTKATSSHADLTLHLSRDHDQTRTFSMPRAQAERSIATILAERADLNVVGGDDLVLQPTS